MKKIFSTIKNIIFDFGGVIIDIDPNAVVNNLKDNGFTDFQRLKEPEFVNILNQFEKGIIRAETFRKKVCSFLNMPLNKNKFDDIWNSMLYDIPERRINLIKNLKPNYHVYLMSNSNEIHYDMFVRDLQLRFGYREFDNLFDKSFFSFDLHLMKPDPDVFTYIFDHYDLKPEETLFIDDTPENILSAQKMGMLTYHLLRGSRVVNLFENGLLREDLDFDIIHEQK